MYFLQENQSKDLSYFGSLQSNSSQDPSLLWNSQSVFDASEFESSFGYKIPFSTVDINNITVRDNGIFRRKTITVYANHSSV